MSLDGVRLDGEVGEGSDEDSSEVVGGNDDSGYDAQGFNEAVEGCEHGEFGEGG